MLIYIYIRNAEIYDLHNDESRTDADFYSCACIVQKSSVHVYTYACLSFMMCASFIRFFCESRCTHSLSLFLLRIIYAMLIAPPPPSHFVAVNIQKNNPRESVHLCILAILCADNQNFYPCFSFLFPPFPLDVKKKKKLPNNGAFFQRRVLFPKIFSISETFPSITILIQAF